MEEIRLRLVGSDDGDNLSCAVHHFSRCTAFVPKYFLRRPTYFLFYELSFTLVFLLSFTQMGSELVWFPRP